MKTHIPMGDGLACGSESSAALMSANNLCSRCIKVVAKRIADLEAELALLKSKADGDT